MSLNYLTRIYARLFFFPALISRKGEKLLFPACKLEFSIRTTGESYYCSQFDITIKTRIFTILFTPLLSFSLHILTSILIAQSTLSPSWKKNTSRIKRINNVLIIGQSSIFSALRIRASILKRFLHDVLIRGRFFSLGCEKVNLKWRFLCSASII